MENVKKHFEEEAKEYDKIITNLIPYYREMTDTLIDVLPFEKQKNIKVLDLGCGTGTISKKVLEKFPNAELLCVDISEKMIEMTKIKLKSYKNVHFQTGNFANIEIKGTFDAAVSSLAIHHLTHKEKRVFYKKVYSLLKPDGYFYNADIILAETEYMQKKYLDKWLQYMKKNMTEKEIDEKWIPTHKNEDKPSKLSDQISQLKEAGFKTPEIVWKYYGFSIFGAIASQVKKT
ncbi:MAG: methyltransferase domain-containing protein [Endomicrobium sp.]|jgi:tRNA (cmo5U34)-methyltransferase|nr:methyltransferase domain-containing protein [Endomicrobium sp.]